MEQTQDEEEKKQNRAEEEAADVGEAIQNAANPFEDEDAIMVQIDDLDEPGLERDMYRMGYEVMKEAGYMGNPGEGHRAMQKEIKNEREKRKRFWSDFESKDEKDMGGKPRVIAK